MEDLAEKNERDVPRSFRRAKAKPTTPASALEPVSHGPPPRVAESPVHLECKVGQIMSIGDGPIAANLVIGEVLLIHIADAVLDNRVPVDPAKIANDRPSGGDFFCRSTDLFPEMERP